MYLTQLRAFWTAFRQQPFTAAEVKLYTYLLDEWDRQGTETIRLVDRTLAVGVDLSLNTMKTARETLERRTMVTVQAAKHGDRSGVEYSFCVSKIDTQPNDCQILIHNDCQKLTHKPGSVSKTDSHCVSKIDTQGPDCQKLTHNDCQFLTHISAKTAQLVDFQQRKLFFEKLRKSLAGKKKESIVYSIVVNSTITFSLSFSLFAREASSGPGTLVPAGITVDGRRVTAERLFDELQLKGVEMARVAEFVEAHPNRVYNDFTECGTVVRNWIKRTQPKAPAQTVKQRQLTLKNELGTYFRANPGKYPDDCYKSFFDYYAEPDSKTGRTIRRDTMKFFDVGKRLDYHYHNIFLKRQQFKNGHGRQQERKLGFISESDLTGNPATADDHGADLYGDDVNAVRNAGLGGIYVTLE